MSKFQFLDKPGYYERQLQRRCNNPLFGDDEEVSNDQLLSARQQDEQELADFRTQLTGLLQEVGQFSGREETDRILEIKERTDRLYEQSMGLAGDLQRERQGLLKLNEVIMNAVRAAAGNDPMAIQELAKEQQAREMHLQMLNYPIVVDMLRPEAIIAENELLPSILSEDKESIQVALSLFDQQQRDILIQQAKTLRENLQGLGVLDEELNARIALVDAAPQ